MNRVVSLLANILRRGLLAIWDASEGQGGGVAWHNCVTVTSVDGGQTAAYFEKKIGKIFVKNYQPFTFLATRGRCFRQLNHSLNF